MNIETLKAKLLEERASLEKELGDFGIKDPETGDWQVMGEATSSDDIADKNDLGDRDEEFGERESTLSELELRLKDINDALSKIDTSDYGKCTTCGQMIEEDRLGANPAAKTCKAHM